MNGRTFSKSPRKRGKSLTHYAETVCPEVKQLVREKHPMNRWTKHFLVSYPHAKSVQQNHGCGPENHLKSQWKKTTTKKQPTTTKEKTPHCVFLLRFFRFLYNYFNLNCSDYFTKRTFFLRWSYVGEKHLPVLSMQSKLIQVLCNLFSDIS